jgi:hypothetical protein
MKFGFKATIALMESDSEQLKIHFRKKMAKRALKFINHEEGKGLSELFNLTCTFLVRNPISSFVRVKNLKKFVHAHMAEEGEAFGHHFRGHFSKPFCCYCCVCAELHSTSTESVLN